MHCPRCSHEMTERTTRDTAVDVCDGGCAGIFFDRFELEKFDGIEDECPGLLEATADPRVIVDHAERIRCPRCDGAIMMRHYFSPSHEVEVDECPACGGFWLDAMELTRIKSLFGSPEEADAAFREFFNANFGAELAQMAARSRGELERAQRFARLFRVLCPSAYMPGKQGWGAF